jgi:hypothetical protein
MTEYAINDLLDTIAHTDDVFNQFELDEDDAQDMLDELRETIARRNALFN